MLLNLKRKKILTHATYNMDKLWEYYAKKISQTEKDKYVCFHLHNISRISKFIERESRLEIIEGWGGEQSSVGI